MPVTKTAKRALRGSTKKATVNTIILNNLEKALRVAKKSRATSDISRAISLADRAVKKSFIHKNKSSRIKSSLSKLAAPQPKAKKAKAKKK
jgi:ribosomal protein S20